MENKKDEICIMFSGGIDSTLCSAICANKYKKLHLLTFDNGAILYLKEANKTAMKLKDNFGKNEFTHQVICIRDLMKLLMNSKLDDFIDYKSPFVLDISCRLAMATKTILYCLENNILNSADGSNYEQSKRDGTLIGFKGASEQNLGFLEETRELFKKYGINFSNPVYKIKNRKKELKKVGINRLPTKICSCFGISDEPRCLHQFWGYPLVRLGLLGLTEKQVIRYYRGKKEIIEEYINGYSTDKKCQNNGCSSSDRCNNKKLGLMEL